MDICMYSLWCMHTNVKNHEICHFFCRTHFAQNIYAMHATSNTHQFPCILLLNTSNSMRLTEGCFRFWRKHLIILFWNTLWERRQKKFVNFSFYLIRIKDDWCQVLEFFFMKSNPNSTSNVNIAHIKACDRLTKYCHIFCKLVRYLARFWTLSMSHNSFLSKLVRIFCLGYCSWKSS